MEQKGIPCPCGQEQAVVPKRIHGMVIFPKTLPFFIIIMMIIVPFPSRMAFDPKMIVGPEAQVASSRPALQYPLGKGNTGRNAVGLHLKLGDLREYLYILLHGTNWEFNKIAGIFRQRI